MNPTHLKNILRNVDRAEALRVQGQVADVLGVVCGSAPATQYWAQRFERRRAILGVPQTIALHEDLPVNQAFGLLLLWQRLRTRLPPGRRALVGFVFGDGTRMSPWTESECGQKPALRSFVHKDDLALTIVELALLHFSPVQDHLHRSGFEGLVVKWGDEIQIPSAELTGRDERLRHADVVRFVSMQPMDEHNATQKDWLGVDADGTVRAFIPRRPLEHMRALAPRGWLEDRGGTLWGGVNLGSIAVGRDLLNALLQEFECEVNDPTADRKGRPDLDPQVFTALTIAAHGVPLERQALWLQAMAQSPAIARMHRQHPDLFPRLVRTVDRLAQSRGRPLRIQAMDFGPHYWGDAGGHRQIFDMFTALNRNTPEGTIARRMAGIPEAPDPKGNRLAGTVTLGEHVTVTDSVLINTHISEGRVHNTVLVGTGANHLQCDGALDVGSQVRHLTLPPRAATYRYISPTSTQLQPGERLCSVFLDDAPLHLSIHESANLKGQPHLYTRPAGPNPISLSQAHQRAVAADPHVTEEHRARATQAARGSDDTL